MTTQKTSESTTPKRLAKFSKPLIWGLSLSVLLLAIFAKLSGDLLYHVLVMFDRVTGELIRGFATPNLTRVAIIITNLGSAYVEDWLDARSRCVPIRPFKTYRRTSSSGYQLKRGLVTKYYSKRAISSGSTRYCSSC